ncbi:chromatin-remodeling complex ATPase chain, putative [Phytophthora infestans T30-4]|uniref:Chromatin-remodeling complex ATPase chain, putative n=1 Tax=Phytophthora infestans (strain T30-4) TaxID=403677 RepID=D0MVY5_PHYIT|nr:chromatin-remodeling complex ATPase chain, putative [Phytophthora infestans T30-4]EEY63798.1 chromatin-remodeling complex ATPase chain, putative [Phytophthora infestans T30-4]|eukprot:XP_002907234.1 chromatin-remodeling complex ATPase chain, putative [Phytophthora infestans T30-4]
MEKKESRADWVAVEAQFQSVEANQPAKAKTAYQFFQKRVIDDVKRDVAAKAAELNEPVELGSISKEISARWVQLSAGDREEFVELGTLDKKRYDEECRARDEEVERERARKREDMYGAVEGKRERKKTRPKRQPRELSEKQLEAKRLRHEIRQQEIDERDELKAEEKRQKEALAKKKSEIASARLKYLLSQSDIFAHFSGQVKKGKKGAALDADEDAETGEQSAEGLDSKKAKGKTKTKKRHDDEDEMDSSRHVGVRITQQPSVIKFGTMRAYQLEGLSWMINLAHQGINGILADEMGLGKTLQTISVLAYFYEFENISGPHIVLVPKSTLSNWLAEFKRWCPSLRAVKFHGNKEERQRCVQEVLCPGLPDDKRKFDVCVTTFEMCLKEKTALCKFAWRYLIIDEAHRIKNESSQFSTVVRMLDTEHRLLLTGTPLQNNLHELWALLNFLLPDVFASSQEFDDWFNLDVDDDEAKKQMISQLHKILRPFMLRRLKADVEKSLPPKKETLLFVGMSEMQKALYKSLLLRDMNTIMGGTGGVSKSALQNIVMQLRKCCGHPYLFEGQEDRTLDPLGEHVVENCGKMVLLDKLLTKLKQRGSRVLIFTQMTRVLDIMEDFCRMRLYDYCRIDGQTSYEDRESSIDEYNKPNSSKFLFLLSTRAGGLGINLYTADVVILYDSDWNPQADLQAQDRAHRIGQKKEVNVYRLVTTDSVEEKIIERAQQKLKLDAMVVQQGRLQEKQSKLTKNDMLEMIRFGADQVFRTTDSTITDEDIDAILARGEQRTEEMKQKMHVHDKGDMLDFKLDGGGCQNHDGIDYSNEKERQEELKRLADAELARQMAEGMGKRERRTVLRHSHVSLEGKHRTKQKQLPKALRLPRIDEWQFYNRKRLIELHEIECANYEQAKTEMEKPPLPPHAQYLTQEQLQEKEQLLSEGFSDWNKPQFFLFIKLLARYGRGNIEAVAREMMKPLDEIERYSQVFLSRGQDELSDWPKIFKSIEKGESKLLEIERLTEETARKVKRYANPWEDMPINYQGKGGKVFTEEEDRVLLCLVNQFGYGAWDRIKQEICSMEMFAFDYYLRSRTAAEIGRRCDALMRICEKDNADLEIREKKENDVRRVLQEQRARLDQQLAAARADVKQHQDRVDELIMKEAKRMQRQREAKRAKKRKERDENEEMVDQHTEALVSFLLQATSMDAAKVALDFCAKIRHEKREELQPSYVLKKIRQVAELDELATKGSLVWTIKPEFANVGKVKLKKENKVLKHEHMTDVSGGVIPIKSEEKSRLPRSPWSPTAMKQQQKVKKEKKKKEGALNSVRKPRSAYVQFSVATRVEVKRSLGEDAQLVDVMKELVRLWKDMTPEQKAPWVEAAKLDKLRYEREMNETTA